MDVSDTLTEEPVRVLTMDEDPVRILTLTDDPVRTVPGRGERRRAAKASCCALCSRKFNGGDRMKFRLPDPRRENWGLMTTGEGHARCVALAERRRAEAAERALAALSEAAKTQQAAAETATRQQALGLWTPR